MAIQQITGKQITKFDTEKLSKNPNFVQPEKPEIKKEVVSGNTIDNKSTGVYKEDTNVYGEKMESMMNTLIGKIEAIDTSGTHELRIVAAGEYTRSNFNATSKKIFVEPLKEPIYVLNTHILFEAE